MVWSIETDDFQGTCHGRRFHLLSTINEQFALGGPGVIPKPPPSPETTVTPVTVATPSTEKTWWPKPSTPSTQEPQTMPPSTETPVTPSSSQTWWTPETPSSTATPVTTSPEDPSKETMPPSTGPGTSEFKCTSSGSFRHPTDCQKFFDCVDQGGEFLEYAKTCPSGTVFDPEQKLCVWPGSVPECKDQFFGKKSRKYY